MTIYLPVTRAVRFGILLSAVLTASFGVSQENPAGDIVRKRASATLEQSPNLPYNPYTLIVRYRAGAIEADRAALRSQVGGIWLSKVPSVPGLEIISTQIEPQMAAERLRRMPGVEYVELDQTVHADVVPNDPSFGSLWGMHNTGQSGGAVDADIDAPEAWDLFTGSSSVVVAVIDTGIQRTHPDLAANTWTNPGEIAGNGIDDDGNGRIDDLYGWDFVNGDNDPNDDNNHGTHCAGTIGGVGNNATGVAGVNWNVKMLGLKFLGSGGSGSISNAILALDYCVRTGIKISNNSWGGGSYTQSMFDMLNTAAAMGHIFVAAAGNANSNNDAAPHYPSSYTNDNVIAVASIDRFDNRSSFSSYGATSVDLGAPGSSILSTVTGSSYSTFSGTSMATPHVAGGIALLWGYRPAWTRQQVKDGILSTVRPTIAMNGVTQTGGVLNVYNALSAATGPANTPPSVTIKTPANGSSSTSGASVSFSGTATDAPDGDLSSNLNWTSNLQGGSIGTGASFSTSALVVGVHTITASVTDSGSLSGSANITFTVNAPAPSVPAAPTNLTATKLIPGVGLNWTDNSGNETGFRIERQFRSGVVWGSTTTFTVGANVATFTDNPGAGRFRYRVQSFNAAGSSAWTAYVTVKL